MGREVGSNRAPALDRLQKELSGDAQMLCPLAFGSSHRAPALDRVQKDVSSTTLLLYYYDASWAS